MILYVSPYASSAYYVPPENVFILLHGDGGNGSTTFTDSGPQNLTATVSGLSQSSAQAKFGVSSIGPITGESVNYVYVEADISSRTVDKFTLEFFVYYVSSSNFSTSPVLVSLAGYDSSNVLDSNSVFNVWNYSNLPKLELNTSSLGVEIPNIAYTANVWTHVAAEFDGTNVSFYVGGVFKGSVGYSIAGASTKFRVTVGNTSASSGNASSVYVDEVRLVMNQIVYGGEFTPPSSAFAP